MFFKNIERWNIIKMSNNIISRSNCVGKETTYVPQICIFMKGVTITLLVQWSAESWECLTAHNIVYFQNAPAPTTIR